ncbi:MAG: GNAT family N-acetyltransferase [Micromonosporaceae bacterium]|nr:GNAT family N-acetyltransferase [Micromonosporaceae bacterium]
MAGVTDGTFPPATLATERLTLRPFRADHAADVHAVWNDEAYLRFAPVGLATAGADLPLALEWCTSQVEQQRRAGHGLSFAVERRDQGRLVGQVALFGTNWTAMVTDIHYWTAPWSRGNGYATEAVVAATRWALCEQGFARVGLRAVTDNVASRRVAEAAEFHFEGVLRHATLTRAGRGDLAVYSRIAQDLPGMAAP